MRIAAKTKGVILLSVCLLLVAYSAPTHSQLNRRLKSIRAQKRHAQQELRTTRRKARVVRGDLVQIDSNLTQIEQDLEDTGDRLDSSRHEQSRLRVDLQAAQTRLKTVRGQVRKRIRHIYTSGNTTVVSVLISSRSMSDFASSKVVLERIAEQDKRTFTEYNTLCNRVADQKAHADLLVRRITRLARQQEDQQADLKDTQQEKKETLVQLQSKEASLKQLLSQFEADESSIEAQIDAFARRTGGGPKFTGAFMRPVSAPITSGFGSRYHPILKIRRLHAGVDFGARSGAPIVAAASGEVVSAQRMRGYGNVVIIAHGGGISTVYAHCSRIYVRAGQKVTKGQRIAAVGATGLATGPHLHFEIRVNGKPVNPMSKL